MAYINLKLEKADGTAFTEGQQTLVVIPQTPAVVVASLNGTGMSTGGLMREIKMANIQRWNRTMYVATVGADTKEIYITGFYKF